MTSNTITLAMLVDTASPPQKITLMHMFCVVVFQDAECFLISCAVASVILCSLVAAIALFTAGTVTHRRKLWIAGLIVGLASLVLVILSLVAIFMVYTYWVGLAAAEQGRNL